MSDDISTSAKLTASVACLLVWLVLCMPIWILEMGIAGTFHLPSLALDATDMFLFSLIYCALFYGLLLCSGAMALSAFMDTPRPRPAKDLEGVGNARDEGSVG